MVLQIPYRSQSGAVKLLGRDTANSMQCVDRQWPQELEFTGLLDERETIRFFVICRQLGQQFVRGNPDASGQLSFLEDVVLNCTRYGQGQSQALIHGLALAKRREIQVSLIY